PHFHGRRDQAVRHRRPRLGAEHQLGRRSRRDTEAAARRGVQADRGGGERIARARLVERERGEARHPVHRGDRRRPAERAAARVGAEHDRDVPVKPGTGFPAGSSAVTWTAGLIAAPATVVDGWTVKANWVAVPGMMSNGVLVTEVTPLALAVSV